MHINRYIVVFAKRSVLFYFIFKIKSFLMISLFCFRFTQVDILSKHKCSDLKTFKNDDIAISANEILNVFYWIINQISNNATRIIFISWKLLTFVSTYIIVLYSCYDLRHKLLQFLLILTCRSVYILKYFATSGRRSSEKSHTNILT